MGYIRAQIHVPQLRSGRAGVDREGRSVAVGNDRLSDEFAPLGVHVYVQPQ
jgi:hypothetical protein